MKCERSSRCPGEQTRDGGRTPGDALTPLAGNASKQANPIRSDAPGRERAQYGVAKANPIKRYAEEVTFLYLGGDLRGAAVLDLACGSGYYTRALKRRGADKLASSTPSSWSRTARRHYGEAMT
jgi:2-polyprenyl-3-methyl-5-hydroxy-6-metoxy-1,4-benzoquinol methylase